MKEILGNKVLLGDTEGKDVEGVIVAIDMDEEDGLGYLVAFPEEPENAIIYTLDVDCDKSYVSDECFPWLLEVEEGTLDNYAFDLALFNKYKNKTAVWVSEEAIRNYTPTLMDMKGLFSWMVCRDINTFEQIGPEVVKRQAERYMGQYSFTVTEFNEQVAEYRNLFNEAMAQFFKNIFKEEE